MASTVPMARSRGSLSGLALVLLGAWGGLALLVGPYFNFGFSPDQAWSVSMARLYASFLPGAVVVLCGLIVLVTRSRGLGGTAAVFAALAGVWFTVGRSALVAVGAALGNPSIARLGDVGLAGSVHGDGGASVELADFLGVGVLIVFFAALALGRFSLAAHKDHARYAELEAAGLVGVPGGGLDNVGLTPSNPPFDPYQATQPSPAPTPPAVVGGETRFPSQYPPDRFPTEQSPSPQSPTAMASPPWDPAPPATEQANIPASGFTPGPVTYSAGQTRYPPSQEQQTTSMTAPTEEHQLPPDR